MDLPRLALLKQIRIRLSSEGKRSIYLGHDTASGRIFSLPANVANSLRRMKAAAEGNTAAREAVSNDEAREAYKFLHTIDAMRRMDALGTKSFNPVFANIPMFNVAPLQPRLYWLADWLVGVRFVIGLVILMSIAVFLGARNDWLIVDVFDNVFSIDALVTFGLVAPLLKLVHEFGHVLVATKARVKVRQAGLYIIGLYPMPYVDCTEADIAARKMDRIAISVAGIAVDVTIGLTAMIAWHMVDGSFLRTLCGNIFLFSTLNSVLFNANPLIKLDGYYAFADAIGARNLYTRSSKTLSQLVLFCMSLGHAGSRPRRGAHWAIVLYAILTFLYRLNILYFIATSLIPKYLGVGAFVTAWGAYVMLVNPLLQDKAAKASHPAPTMKRIWTMRCVLLAGAIAALLFIELPFRTSVPMTLDVTGRYQYTTRTSGTVVSANSKVQLEQGDTILKLASQRLVDQLALTEVDLAMSQLQYETVRGEDPVKASAALEAIKTDQEQVAILRKEIEGLHLVAPFDGTFVSHGAVPIGTYFESGTAIGAFFPNTPGSQLTGPFDERYYLKFQDGPDMVTLRIKEQYVDLPLDAATLQSVVTQDNESGKRAYTLKLRYEPAASVLATETALARVRFPPEPLWRHILFILQGTMSNFREAQLLDRSRLLDG